MVMLPVIAKSFLDLLLTACTCLLIVNLVSPTQVTPVAAYAFPRRWLIKQNEFAIYQSGQLVASLASHTAVRAFQSKGRLFIMVKKRWLPVRRAMTTITLLVVGIAKLASMDVGVASRALSRCQGEINLHEPSSCASGLVAIGARNGLMSAA
jgi:hypothetical protein